MVILRMDGVLSTDSHCFVFNMFSDLSAMFVALNETVVVKSETKNHQKFVSGLDAKVARVVISIHTHRRCSVSDFKRSTLAAVFDLSAMLGSHNSKSRI